MRAFRWTRRFETGIDSVDHQHMRLVDLLNELGAGIHAGGIDCAETARLLDALLGYAAHHFAEEEALMLEHAIDARHADSHIAEHRAFAREVVDRVARKDRCGTGEQAELFEFLVHWLTYHILVRDQAMATQLDAIERGATPADAFDAARVADDDATEPLRVALVGLFEQLSIQNEQLRQLNATLEERVHQRTLELQEANEALDRLAHTDPLTGLPNRRRAMRRLEGLLRESRDENRALACLVVDADYFKPVNDRWGHEAGDLVLRRLGQALQHGVRTDDLVCRVGGDEFVVVCPDTDLIGALYLAEHLLTKVRELRVPVGDGEWSGSVSIGVADLTPDVRSVDDLLRAADEAVYFAKAAGRGCVRAAQQPRDLD